MQAIHFAADCDFARRKSMCLAHMQDEQILPAVYNFVGTSFHATPSQLGNLTLCRALVQALSSPIGGLLGETDSLMPAQPKPALVTVISLVRKKPMGTSAANTSHGSV